MKSETGRGFKEARVQLEVLRARWPQAFPLEAREVRPLERRDNALSPFARSGSQLNCT